MLNTPRKKATTKLQRLLIFNSLDNKELKICFTPPQ